MDIAPLALAERLGRFLQQALGNEVPAASLAGGAQSLQIDILVAHLLGVADTEILVQTEKVEHALAETESHLAVGMLWAEVVSGRVVDVDAQVTQILGGVPVAQCLNLGGDMVDLQTGAETLEHYILAQTGPAWNDLEAQETWAAVAEDDG